ncbi:hypothetical protein [Agrobacterium sp.]|uniref:hypothetical protein n=1 Tax=Agrobacterium sp. TaxID=361 RepID=UPI0028AD2E41|nr:hypothetical protein [Agrobacterium sp.]
MFRHQGKGFSLKSLISVPILLVLTAEAHAHGAERGLVMLLPTGFYQTGGALAVLLSFLLLAVVPADWFEKGHGRFIRLAPSFSVPKVPLSCLSFIVLASCVLAGFIAPSDPLSNPLPLIIWTGWWVGFTLLQVLTGNLWPWLNPWTGLVAVMRQVLRAGFGKRQYLGLPLCLGFTPAILQFSAFAWFELGSLAPDDPPRLAMAIIIYWLVNFAGILLFGERAWLDRAEPFSVFFRMIGMVSPFAILRAGTRDVLVCTWPGQRCLKAEPLPPSGVVFMLLTLATASFDGFSETFTWLGFIGVNPLEFPGRSGVMFANTLGLAVSPVLLISLFYMATVAGAWLSGERQVAGFKTLSGRLVYSIIPISIAFHAAHYLTLLLVNGQYLLVMMSDPFALGWNLLGMSHWHVTTSFLQNIDDVRFIWMAQTAIIVIGHVVGIVLAHSIALDHFGGAGKTVVSQLLLAALMVFYTVFGLWLLSTPSVG